MAELLIVLLGFLGSIFAAGWFLGAWVARRKQRRSQGGSPWPSTGYDEAFRAGFGEGFRAGSAAGQGVAPGAGHDQAPVGSPEVSRPSSDDPYLGATLGPVVGPVPAFRPPAGLVPAALSDHAGLPAGLPAGRATMDHASKAPGPTPALRPVQEPSPEELAAAKAERDLRTINIALYSASLLLVVAGGLFIGAAVPGPTRAVTISAVVALFYVGGLVLHARLERLRPAAVAFTGTGLALVPVAGLLFGVLTGEGSLAWFISAVLGSGAYLLAAVRLQSRIVAYLSLPFFLSIALSSVSLIGAALIWYFTCSIGVAALLAVVAYASPRWLPGVLTRAVLDAHRFLTPMALILSIALGGILPDGDRALLWVVGAVYYAALLVFVPVRRIEHLYALRLVATVAISLIAAALGIGILWGAMVLALFLGLQVTGLLVLALPVRQILGEGTLLDGGSQDDAPADSDHPAQDDRGRVLGRYRLDVLVTFALMTVAAATVTLGLRSSLAPIALPGSAGDARPDALLPALLVLVVGAVVASRLRGRAELLVLAGIGLGFATPWSDPWRAELVVVLSAVYFVTRAARSSRKSRERFLLAARAALVVLLPLTVLVHVRIPDPAGGRLWDLAALAFVLGAVANQVVEVVRVRRVRATSYSTGVIWSASGLSLLATVYLATSAGLGPVAVTALWSCVLVGCGTTLALPLAHEAGPHGGTSAASRRRGTLAGSGGNPKPTPPQAGYVEAVGPVSLVAAALACVAGSFGVRSYEILLATVVVYAALMTRRAIGRGRRGLYLLAAQVAFTSLAAVVAADLRLTVHGVLTATGVSVAVQETARIVLRRKLRDVGLQASSAWLSLAVLAALPFLYGTLAGSDLRLGVVIVQLALLLAVSVTLFVLQRQDLAAYPALYAAAALIAALTGVLRTSPDGWLPRAPLEPWAGALVAAGLLLVLVLTRVALEDERIIRPVWVGAGLLGTEAAVFAFEDGAGWDRVIVAAVVAVAGFTLSRRDALPWLDAGAGLAVIVWSTTLVQQVTIDVGGTPGAVEMQVLLGAVLGGGLLYLARRVLPPAGHRTLRRRLLAAVALGWGAVAAVLAMIPDDPAVSGSVVLAVIAVLTVRELPVQARALAREGVFLVLAASAQRIVWLLLDGASFFWSAQWWVVALALLAAYSFTRGTGSRGPRWLSAAAVVLSGTGLLTLPGGTSGAQIWSLLGHVALLAAGVALSRRLFSLWGATGIVLALLWFLRGYTFVLLTVAAVALIAFAVWKLNGQTRNGGSGAAPEAVPEAVPRASAAREGEDG